MELSNILRFIEPTLSRQLFMMAKQYNDVIDFTLGDPDMPTPRPICEAAYIASLEGKTRYAPNAGILALRESIAEVASKENGIEYSAENVAITQGATEAIYLAFKSILNPGDEVIIIAPYWVQYENIVKLLWAKPVIVDTFTNGFEPDIKAVESAITSKTRAIVINSPNNPSGFIYKEHFLQQVSHIAKTANLFVFSDEVYRSLTYTDYCPSISKYHPKERLIIFNSFSKQFAMTGWRVGYAIAEEEFINAIVKLQQNVAVCIGTPNQYGAIEAMKSADNYRKIIVDEFTRRRETLLKELGKIPELYLLAPEGTFYAFINIEKTGLDSKTFCFSLLEKQHVAIVPGIAFGTAFDNYVRLAFTLEQEKIIEGIKRIKQFIECNYTNSR